jgi:hypothetical protein
MTPAVGGLLPRKVLEGGLLIEGIGLHEDDLNLPEGIDVGVPIYAIHHSFVKNPFSFDPSRWLKEDESHNDRETLVAVFNPFSIGHRACLGKPLVYMELSIAIARLVFDFDMRLSADQHTSGSVDRDVRSGKRTAGEYHLLDWFMSRNEGPWVEFRKRNA